MKNLVEFPVTVFFIGVILNYLADYADIEIQHVLAWEILACSEVRELEGKLSDAREKINYFSSDSENSGNKELKRWRRQLREIEKKTQEERGNG